jgi:hypothetical protein
LWKLLGSSSPEDTCADVLTPPSEIRALVPRTRSAMLARDA